MLSTSAHLYIFAFFFFFFFYLHLIFPSCLSFLTSILLLPPVLLTRLCFAPPSLDEISMAHSAILPLLVSPCLSQLLSQQIYFLFGPDRPGHHLTRALPSNSNYIRKHAHSSNTYKWNIKCNEIFKLEEYHQYYDFDVVLACLSVLIPAGVSLSVLRNQGGAQRERQRQREVDEIQSLLSLQQISFIRLVVC